MSTFRGHLSRQYRAYSTRAALVRIVYRLLCNVIVEPAITSYTYQPRFISLRDCMALISLRNNGSKISRPGRVRVALPMTRRAVKEAAK